MANHFSVATLCQADVLHIYARYTVYLHMSKNMCVFLEYFDL